MGRGEHDVQEGAAFALADSPSHLLHRAEQLAGDRFARLMGDGLKLRQFALLATIAARPGLNQNQLVRATGIDRSTLAEMVTRMQRNGWIARTVSSKDARAYAVQLTSAGAAMLTSATPHAKAADAAILDALPRAKRKAFLNTLRLLAAFADAVAAREDRDAKRERGKEKTREKSPKPRGKRA